MLAKLTSGTIRAILMTSEKLILPLQFGSLLLGLDDKQCWPACQSTSHIAYCTVPLVGSHRPLQIGIWLVIHI
jgi:hypothetical protein